MLNVLLDTKQVISGTLFTDNLLTSSENSRHPYHRFCTQTIYAFRNPK